MKSRLLCRIARLPALAFLSALNVFITLPSHADDIVHLTIGEWPPYTSQQSPFGGFAAHVVTEAFSAVGMDVEYRFLPWARAGEYAKRGRDTHGGEWHGSVGWAYTEERSKYYEFSDALGQSEQVLFFLKSRPVYWKELSDLKGKTIGVTLVNPYSRLSKAAKNGLIYLDTGGGYEVLLTKLLYRQIDAISMTKEVGLHYLENNYSEEEKSRIDYSPVPLSSRDFYVVFSKEIKKNKMLREKFNRGLSIIKRNGTYDLIYKNLQEGKYH
ncbi:substrate-binding periplasmic protein [Vibrio sp. HN007]|uniref:substrate-binding periplasmic protein n=1 Tax=Vibrio iocasae TaxID=3098914 RepID=UPI0035D46189